MKCAKCQSELKPGDQFCGECGFRVAAVAESAAASPPRPLEGTGEIRRYEGHQGAIVKVAFLAGGRQAASISEDGAIHVWDTENGRVVSRQLGVGVISAAAISPRSYRALTFVTAMHLWDLESGREIQRFDVKEFITAVALSPDGRLALFDGPNNSLRLWDLSSGRELHRLEGHTTLVDCIAFSPDGRYALSGATESDYSDRAVILWDLRTGRELRVPERMMMLVDDVTFSPDGRRALACCADGNIYLWEVDTGFELHRYEGHSGNVFAVAFSPDGTRFLSASGTDYYDADMLKELGVDNTVRLWDAERQREIQRFEGHQGNVNCVAISPDGGYALSGSKDKTVRLWRLPG